MTVRTRAPCPRCGRRCDPSAAAVVSSGGGSWRAAFRWRRVLRCTRAAFRLGFQPRSEPTRAAFRRSASRGSVARWPGSAKRRSVGEGRSKRRAASMPLAVAPTSGIHAGRHPGSNTRGIQPRIGEYADRRIHAAGHWHPCRRRPGGFPAAVVAAGPERRVLRRFPDSACGSFRSVRLAAPSVWKRVHRFKEEVALVQTSIAPGIHAGRSTLSPLHHCPASPMERPTHCR